MEQGYFNKKIFSLGVILALLHLLLFIYTETTCSSFGCLVLFMINPLLIVTTTLSHFVSVYLPQSPITFLGTEFLGIAIFVYIFFVLAKFWYKTMTKIIFGICVLVSILVPVLGYVLLNGNKPSIDVQNAGYHPESSSNNTSNNTPSQQIPF